MLLAVKNIYITCQRFCDPVNAISLILLLRRKTKINRYSVLSYQYCGSWSVSKRIRMRWVQAENRHREYNNARPPPGIRPRFWADLLWFIVTLGIEQPLPCQQLLGMRVSLPVVVQESSHCVLRQDVVADLLLHEPEMFRDILLIFPETNCIFLYCSSYPSWLSLLKLCFSIRRFGKNLSCMHTAEELAILKIIQFCFSNICTAERQVQCVNT